MMSKTLVAAFLSAALVFPAAAQVTTATFYGTVTDPSGAVVAEAVVTLTNEGTQATQRQTTNPDGEFSFNFVPVGTYSLRIQATGFKVSVGKGIRLSAGESVRLRFPLELGAVAETVEVTADAPLVNTVSAEQRETVTTKQVIELPLARRNVANVVTLSTGVTRTGGDVYFNGSGRGGSSFSVDGTDATSNPERPSLAMFGDFNYINGISMEAVGEVQITKGVIPAEYTRSMGGNMNIISKSGTNEFHGSLFENFRADNLNARNQFLRTKPGVTFNQFGGSLGGPILRDKLFFFGVYEGYRERAFRPVDGNVPTPRLRDAMLNAVPAYKLWLDTVPLPNQSFAPDAATGQFIGAGSLKNDENHFVIRPDYRISDRATASVTWTRFRPQRNEPRVQDINSRTFGGETDRISAILTTFFGSWTSESRYGYNYNHVNRIDNIFNVVDPNKPEDKFGSRRIPCISALGFGGCGEILSLGAPNHSFDQKIALNFGQHSLKFGGVYFRRNIGRSNIENPGFSYQNEADLLANIPNSITFTFGVDPYTATANEFGLFVQDDWKISRKLTVNLGLRYDFFGHYVARGPDGGAPSSFNRAGFIDSNFTLGPLRDINNPYDNDAANIGPRFGFSYNPDGNGKTVIRGGASTMFTNLAGETFTQTVQNSLTEPFRSRFSRQEALDHQILYPFYNADALSLVSGGSGLGGSPRVLDPHMQSAYSINLYLGVQRELTRSMALEAAYVGIRGVKWQTSRNANEPDRFTGLRRNPVFATMDYWDNADNTWYNAFQTSLRKRYSHGIAANFHYTFGKSIAYGSGDTGWTGSNAQDFFDLRSNRGLADGSVLHSFVSDIVYDLPRFTNANRFIQHSIGGWQISGITSISSGAPLLISQPSALTGSRPDYVGGPPTLDDARDTLQYLNRAAFVQVPVNASRAPIRPGNLGRNAVMGPGLVNFDISLGKNFSITERYRIQFRADMFNAFNHTNYSVIETNTQSANFGRMTSTRGAREIQLNARFSF